MMSTHERKVERIARQLRERTGTGPVSLKKKAVSHEVPKPGDGRRLDEKIDVSDLDEILLVDPGNRTCVAEPGVTFVDLVKATLEYGLVPFTVPELKTITVGGAVAGCSIESMSYKYGGFHDSCLEYEIVTARGDVLVCTPDNEHSLLFQMAHGTFGTLGILTRLRFKLLPAKPFVKVDYEKYGNLDEYGAAIRRHYETGDVDFMDGIIHSPTEYVLSVANFVDEAPYRHSYEWLRVYYKSTARRKEDYMTTTDYFFRYDKGVTDVIPKAFWARLLFGKFINSSRTLRIANQVSRLNLPSLIPVTVDTFIPFSRIGEFMAWYEAEVNHYPLWCVPYKGRCYEWINRDLFDMNGDELFLDIAIYGMSRRDGKNYYRMLEEELMEIGGIKTLISNNYYTEEEFWGTWNKENYDKAKLVADPDNVFRNLYTKTCRTTRGLGG